MSTFITQLNTFMAMNCCGSHSKEFWVAMCLEWIGSRKKRELSSEERQSLLRETVLTFRSLALFKQAQVSLGIVYATGDTDWNDVEIYY